MDFHRTLLILCLGICLSVAYGNDEYYSNAHRVLLGKPDSAPVSNRPPECQGIGTLVCIAPMMGIAFSPEAQQLSQPGAKFSQIVTQSFYNTLCSTLQTVASCFDGYFTRCSPPEALADMQLLSRGVTQVLSVCNETDSYAKFTKLASCGEKIKIPAETCGEAAERSVPEAERQLRSGFSNENDAILYFRNPQKQICCHAKAFKDCITPSLQSTCSVEEKTLAESFGDRVLRAFECSDAVYQTCVRP